LNTGWGLSDAGRRMCTVADHLAPASLAVMVTLKGPQVHVP
jgi:hypothetical protein